MGQDVSNESLQWKRQHELHYTANNSRVSKSSFICYLFSFLRIFMLQLWGLYSNLRSWHIYFLNKNTMFVMPTLFLFHSCAIIELAKSRWFSFCNWFELLDQIWAQCVQLWGHLFLMAQTLYFFSDRSTPLGHFGRFAEYSIVWNANFEFSCTAFVCLLHGIISSGDVDGRLGGCGEVAIV